MPVPSPAAPVPAGKTKFWDRVAARYSKQPIADQAAYEKKLAVTQTYFRPDMQVLEIGCGTGGTAIIHAPHVAHIRAVDISANMLDIARAKADAAGVTNVVFEQADIDTLAVAPQSVDAVLGLSIVHLLADRDAAIAKVYDWLKPGGIFVTSTVCLGDSMKWLKLVGPIGRALGLMPLVRIFTDRQLQASITGAGFAIDHHWSHAKGGRAVFIVARKE